jgi:[acyl-carrier-protein] S-malonyltransferase
VSLGLIVSGQGQQHPAMLRWLLADASRPAPLSLLDGAIGAGWPGQLDDPAWLGRNAVAQPLLTALALAAWQRLQALLPMPAAVAGYSVGELAAAAIAGALDMPTALWLAQRRAALMDACTDAQATGLLALSGAPTATLREMAGAQGLEMAIDMGPGRAIVGGPRARLEDASREALARGWRAQLLAVPVASHTSWMQAAVPSWSETLAAAPVTRPRLALITAVDAERVRDPESWRQAAALQLARPLRWMACMQALVEQGVSCVLEVGPGHALSRLWNEHWPDRPARSVDEFSNAQAIGQWVSQGLAKR